jgi:2-amino-4-hydroxy-6-hydroxymethyldihydropteridine diphosphokinase
LSERAFISIGSNIDPERNLPVAVERLREIGTVVAVSKAYRNPAIGPTPQPDFLNAAALVETALDPITLVRALRRIETDMGRRRGKDLYAPRTIDLDLCLYGSAIDRRSKGKLPHPDLVRHAHVAVPVAELDPAFRHPVTGETLADLARRLSGSVRLAPQAGVLRVPSAAADPPERGS